jgi:hypothetical protein
MNASYAQQPNSSMIWPWNKRLCGVTVYVTDKATPRCPVVKWSMRGIFVTVEKTYVSNVDNLHYYYYNYYYYYCN